MTHESLSMIQQSFERHFGLVNDFKNKKQAKCRVCDSLDSKKKGNALIECLKCGDVYHLQCFDPPLKIMPRGYSWQCEECDEERIDHGL